MNRSVIRVSGPESRDFMQGLVTNDVTKLDAGPVYAALLTPQGKYIADFFLIADGDDVLIDADAEQAAALLQRLTMYRLRAKIDLDMTDIVVTCGLGPAPAGAVADPRDTALGWRSYSGVPDEPVDWDALRVAQMIPAAGIELTPDSYILEMGFERLNGVDFRKGCYVGQEVTARMKHKTELKKGLAKVSVDGAAAPGTPILADGKPAGTLFTRSGDEALAYLRFDRATGEMMAGDARLRRSA